MNQYRFQKSKKGRKEDILETMEKADEAVSDANEEKLNVSSDDPDQLIIFQWTQTGSFSGQFWQLHLEWNTWLYKDSVCKFMVESKL